MLRTKISMTPEPLDVSGDQFSALFQRLSAWGPWGDADECGALHHLSGDCVGAAARLVRDGITISLSWPLNTVAAAHDPHPAEPTIRQPLLATGTMTPPTV